MTDLTRISIISTAETALKKLKSGNIAVYNCKKDGARFIFSIKDKDIKKVFAIFAKSCYNISVIGESRRFALKNGILARIGLFIGGFIFIAAALLSNAFLLKIEVSGTGSYLSPEVKRIIYQSGAKQYGYFSGFDAPAATGKILALPDVTFCNIQKRGAVLFVDVQVDRQNTGSVARSPLISDVCGKVTKLITICGTPAVGVGDAVKRGDTLIYARELSGEKYIDCLVVGYAVIECGGKIEYRAAVQSQDGLKAALAATALYAENIISRTASVRQEDGAAIYTVEFTYLHTVSINMG